LKTVPTRRCRPDTSDAIHDYPTLRTIYVSFGGSAVNVSGQPALNKYKITPYCQVPVSLDNSGTENLVSIAAFAAACEEEKANFDAHTAHTAELRAYLEERLAALGDEVSVNRPEGAYLANICNLSVKGIRSEVMLNHLSSLGVYVSAGSACSAHAKKQSQALTAFGLDKSAIESAVRISLSHENTKEDIDALIAGMESGLARLKKR